MTDRIYLSLWLRGYSQANMLQMLGRVLERLPVSVHDRAASLRVFAMELIEPALIERHFEEAQVDEIILAARDFDNPDYAYEVDLRWDLWEKLDTWKLTPNQVRVIAFGPEFPSDMGEHLLIDFGQEYLYLPGENEKPNWTALRSNIRSVLRLVSDCEEALPIAKRLLWSDSGEDLADRIEAALGDS